MSSISSIQNNNNNLYSQISSGNKLNKAKNGAAELAMVQKMNMQSNGLSVGRENIGYGKAALNISDGGMSGISDYLQDIRALALRASNGLMSQSDKEDIQSQISQLTSGINDAVSQTRYNETDMLKGGDAEIPIVASSDGSVTQISKTGLSAADLGIENFDVTGDFDISAIDKAIDKVNSMRSQNGAEYNALEHAERYNAVAEENTVAAASQLGDTDIAKAMMELQKGNTLNQMSMLMQKRMMENNANRVSGLLGV